MYTYPLYVYAYACAALRNKQLSLVPVIFDDDNFWAAGRRPYIVFTFTGSVWNVRNDVNIYICQQHGGLLGGSRSCWYYSVNFVSLLLFSSTKNL